MSAGTAFQQSVRRFIRRRVLEPLAQRRSFAQLSALTRQYRNTGEMDLPAIRKWRRAWGNEAYSADADYVGQVLASARQCNGPILECGSGLTTLIAALATESRDIKVWSLEQDESWAAFMHDRLDALGIRNASVIHAPLRDFGTYVWYDISRAALPKRFALALCDGPAVFPHWGDAALRWRYGLLPAMHDAGAVVDSILLDDADEPRAERLISEWCEEFSLTCAMLKSDDGACAWFSRTV